MVVPQYRGIEDSRWAALVDGGLGLLAQVGARVALAFEIHASLAAPHPVVRFSGSDAATIGRPALMATWTSTPFLSSLRRIRFEGRSGPPGRGDPCSGP